MPKVADRSSMLLRAGTRLVHIGPPKTGTTALQGALNDARSALPAQGVRYANQGQNSRFQVYAALERRAYGYLRKPPPIEQWSKLVDEIRSAPEPRVILSSEIFADGGPEVIRRVVDDLDPARLHIAVTLRPLPRILASQWQQEVRGGQRTPFDTWLGHVFSEQGSTATHFWHRHRHERLIASWAAAVGVENVTVVVVDERDHGMILRAFEQLLGLRDGTLVEVADRTNRSMSLPEVEAVRAFNVVARAIRLRPAWRHRLSRVVRRIVILPEADPREPRLETPQWALDRAGEIAREMVDAIIASGVRIVGDIESLAAPQSSSRADDPPPDTSASPSVARSFWQLSAMLLRRGRTRVLRRLGVGQRRS